MHKITGVGTAVKQFQNAEYLGILSLRGIWSIATTPSRRVRNKLGDPSLGECIWIVKPYKRHKGAIVLAFKKSTKEMTVSGTDGIEAKDVEELATKLGLTFEIALGVNPSEQAEEFNIIVAKLKKYSK